MIPSVCPADEPKPPVNDGGGVELGGVSLEGAQTINTHHPCWCEAALLGMKVLLRPGGGLPGAGVSVPRCPPFLSDGGSFLCPASLWSLAVLIIINASFLSTFRQQLSV